jgi:hypothetical protein
MPLTHKPNPMPSEIDYIPANSEPYLTTGGESFYSLADLPQVKSAGLSPLDLCYFNFKTRKQSEINWYLKHKIGCTKATKDGKNYMFSTSDTPGIVFLPKLGVAPPVNEYPKTPEKDEIIPLWIGVGVKGGTMFGPVGIETLGGFVINVGANLKGMAITGTTNRIGLGGGASGGVCVILITGVTSPSQLNGLLLGDTDYNVSLGPNWGKLAKLKKVKPLLDVFQKFGALTGGALKALLKTPDGAVNVAKAAKAVKDVYGSEAYGEPNVIVADIPPLGYGVELSVFFGVSKFNAVVDNTD